MRHQQGLSSPISWTIGILADEKLHKIGDVAELLSTSVRTIRYYEEEDLLTPVRTVGGTRLYSKKQIDRLKAILNLTRNGYPIEAINNLAHLREKHHTGDKSQHAISMQFDEWLSDIDSQVGALKQLSLEIKAAKQTIQKCSGCQNHPSTKGCPTCPVRGYLSDIELLNLIWDQEEQ